MLTIEDHRRDSAGMTYVYPVISRRAGGVSIGVNLNVNNACNWACAYCQVEGLTKGGPPPIDLDRLADELDRFLDDAISGDFMARAVPSDSRRLVDVAFSGNGEPTSAAEFPEAVRRVRRALAVRGLLPQVKIRLITNGSFLHRQAVQEGIREIGAAGGEVWFKVDRIGEEATRAVNGVPSNPETVRRHLETCAGLAPTWVQTCWFAVDGRAPSEAEQHAYVDFLRPFAGKVSGIHLYGLARPSFQPGAERLGRLDAGVLDGLAQAIQKETGIRVLASP
jgi:wyosine [tRNA(Phe)-imidazoG37] synthetase (radical SAM superfamily)